MDHIPLPKNRIDLGLRVPYFDPSDYGIQLCGVAEFAKENGLHANVNGLVAFETLERLPVEQAIATVQSWLYFGLLAQAQGSSGSIPEGFVTKDEDGKFSVSSKGLPDFMRRCRDHTTKNREEWQQRMRRVSRQLCEFDQNLQAAGDVWSRVLLSIGVLLETIDYDCNGKFGGWKRIASWNLVPFATRFSIRTLLEDASADACSPCEKRLARVIELESCAILIYMASLNHSLSERQQARKRLCNHSNRCCCFDFRRHEATYPHTESGCTCTSVVFQKDDMATILANGGFPVIECVRRNSNIVSACYKRASPGRPFVAISHLWVDELAHPDGGHIRSCKLNMLLDGIEAADLEEHDQESSRSRSVSSRQQYSGDERTFHIWLDFLCVPQAVAQQEIEAIAGSQPPRLCGSTSQNLQDLQARALALIPLIYSRAAFVLVLDQQIQHFDSHVDALEFAAFIGLCGWNSRYWTYQEAQHARRLWFKARDGVVEPFRKGRRYRQNAWSWRGHVVPCDTEVKSLMLDALTWLSFPHTPLGLRSDVDRKGWGQFRCHQNALTVRNTTLLQDAVSILAILLFLSPEEVTSFQGRDQVKAVLRSQSALPCQLLAGQSTEPGVFLDPAHDLWVPPTLHSMSHVFDTSFMFFRKDGLGISADSFGGHSQSALVILEVMGSVGSSKPFDVEYSYGHAGAIRRMRVTPRTTAGCTEIYEWTGPVTLLLWPGDARNSGFGACLLVRKETSAKEWTNRRGKRVHRNGVQYTTFGYSFDTKAIEAAPCGAVDSDLRLVQAYATALERKDILLDCNIKLWPKLQRRRDSTYGNVQGGLGILLMIMVPLGVGGWLSLTVAGNQLSSAGLALVLVLGIPAIVCLIIAIYLPLMYIGRARVYLREYDLRPSAIHGEAEERVSTWARLRSALPSPHSVTRKEARVVKVLRGYIRCRAFIDKLLRREAGNVDIELGERSRRRVTTIARED